MILSPSPSPSPSADAYDLVHVFDVVKYNASRHIDNRMTYIDVCIACDRIRSEIINFRTYNTSLSSCTVEMMMDNISDIAKENRDLFYEIIRSLPALGVTCRSRKIQKIRENSRRILNSRVRILPLNKLNRSLTTRLMHAFYLNEDRVWRSRGGRPGTETVGTFLAFASDVVHGHDPYPGVVAIATFDDDDTPPCDMKFNMSDVLGYVVGEYDDVDTYEVVTAFCRVEARGIGLATRMYRALIHDIYYSNSHPPRHVILDVLEHSMDRMISSNKPWQVLHSLYLDRFIVSSSPSYTVEYDESVERFERIVLAVAPLAIIEHALGNR